MVSVLDARPAAAGRAAAWRRALGAGAAIALMLCGCGSGSATPVPIEQARAMSEEMLPPLQDALLTGPDAQWTDGREQATTDVRGTCRWTPGDATAETAIPQEKSTWMERRDAVNDVLEDHGFDAVWEPRQKNGTYGFSTSREDGAGIALYATKGGTVIRLFNVPVADGACE